MQKSTIVFAASKIPEIYYSTLIFVSEKLAIPFLILKMICSSYMNEYDFEFYLKLF